MRSAQQPVRKRLMRYTELFDFAPIGYATIDANDVIHDINFAGARLIGAPRSKVIGRRFGSMVDPDDTAAYDALTARVRAHKNSEAYELRVRAFDPITSTIVRLTATVQPREPAALLLAFEDVTRRRREQDRLAETESALRDANARKDEFLAMLSHELRDPLAPIRTSLYVLASAKPGTAAATEARELVERQVDHLTHLVDDLLDVTRISRGKIRLQRERVDLLEAVKRTIEDHRPGFVKRQLGLVLAPARGPFWIDADPARIVQAISNVLGNAQKFTPAGGRIAVSLQRNAGTAELRVRDTGSGISPELLPHVFEPFRQAPQALDRSEDGAGLGLAMVKGFIELHGGSVRIANGGVDRGVEIVITLPMVSARAAAPTVTAQRRSSRRVLVIEDQPDTAHALETALTMRGLQVRIAMDGPAGLEVARTFHPEVVLCDIGLPGMDGLEVARSFRRDRELSDTYLVALSGYAQPDDVDRSISAGFSRHLAKPATLDTLMKVITSAP